MGRERVQESGVAENRKNAGYTVRRERITNQLCYK